MRRRKEQRSEEDESEGSEVADEPDEFQDSGEDWTPGAEAPATVSVSIRLRTLIP